MSGIFLIHNDGTLVEMKQSRYETEDLLQELIAKYPNLLAGDQISSNKPRRWLLIRREMPVADETGAIGRWSLDHLFIDQDAIPTLIEVKRSTDTRIRREIVGQMLEYAANSVVYCPAEQMRAHFEYECEKSSIEPAEKIRQFLGDEIDIETFWQQAKTNLQAGRIRMVFVADEIPRELQRIVEYLNQQMEFAEVLAIEIKQFVAEGVKTYVPRLIGQTAEAMRTKGISSRQTRKWDEASFLEECARTQNSDIFEATKQLLNLVKSHATKLLFGAGSKYGNAMPFFDDERGKQQWINISTHGSFCVHFGSQKSLPFSNPELRCELFEKLNLVPGITLSQIAIDRYPNIPLEPITKMNGLPQLLEVVAWAIRQIEVSRSNKPLTEGDGN